MNKQFLTANRLWLAHRLTTLNNLFRFTEYSASPLIDLLIRIYLAKAFFISGIIKISNWENALALSQYEYPVTWMDPVTAAYLGVSVELIAALLLAVGLGTRFAAFSMLLLSLVIQFNYHAFDMHLLWAALFCWFVLRGAGAWSLDHLFTRGLADSAIPSAKRWVDVLSWVSRKVLPFFQLMLRGWLVCTLLLAVQHYTQYAAFFPVNSAKYLVQTLGWVVNLVAVGLLLGFATRGLSALLLLITLLIQMQTTFSSTVVCWCMVLALFILHGAGRWSIDASIYHRLRKVFPQLEGKPAFSLQGLPKVVIVGAGFGGITCASKLVHVPAQVTLVDRHNYHLFQPLLYQVATAALAPGDIAEPIRGLFKDYFNTRVLLGNVQGVDTAQQEVILEDQRLPYDYLVLATGASHSYFGKDEWMPFAPGLKRIEDATEVRRRILTAFEQAEACTDAVERASLLTFLIVGGGPTGVELAGSIAELARFGMEKEFRNFDPSDAKVILVQAGSRLLPTFPEDLSAFTKQSLENLGVRVLLNSRVEAIDTSGVRIGGVEIPSRTVLWAAGVVASPAAKWLNADSDSAGRIKVMPDLSVSGYPNIFAVGDTALVNAWQGNPVPGLAPAAKQGGAYVASVIQAMIEKTALPASFQYTHLGSLATIGRKVAIADFGFIRLKGTLAWWLWGVIHVGFLVGLRNRVSVMFDWFWAYLTFKSGSRLITGARLKSTTDTVEK